MERTLDNSENPLGLVALKTDAQDVRQGHRVDPALISDEWFALAPDGPDTSDRAQELFFAAWLPALSELLLDDAGWFDRVANYASTHAPDRYSLRPRDINYAVNRKQLEIYWSWFEAARLSGQDADDEDTQVTHESYRLELEALLAFDRSEQATKLSEAAELCKSRSSTSQRREQLLRRAASLAANASKYAAFAELDSRGYDLSKVVGLFHEARQHAAQAQGIYYIATDTQPSYLAFWEYAAKVRLCQVDLKIKEARKAHHAAVQALQFLRSRDVVFQRSGHWISFRDFDNELLIIDALAALRLGIEGVAVALKHVNSWLEASADLNRSLRYVRMEARATGLALLTQHLAGQDVEWRRHRYLEHVDSTRGMGSHTHAFAHTVVEALENRDRLQYLVAELRKSFPLDAHFPDPDSLSIIDWRRFPRWYEMMRWSDSDVGIQLTLREYCRTVVDYLWSWYRDALKENYGQQVDAPDLIDCSFVRLEEYARSLKWAVPWTGRRADARSRFCELLRVAARSQLQSQEAAEILTAVVRETGPDLFPLVVLVEESEVIPVSEGVEYRSKLRRFERDQPPMIRIARARCAVEVGGYAYLSPDTKAATGRVGEVGLNRALVVSEPRSTVVLCEGPSDRAAIETFLESQDEYWRALPLKVYAAGGDRLPQRFDGLDPTVLVVVVADRDKAWRSALARPWRNLWQSACWSYLHPSDLERIDLTATAIALSAYWDREITPSELEEIAAEGNFGDAIRSRYVQRELKTGEFGRLLAEALLRVEATTVLSDAARAALRLARGFYVPCQHHTEVRLRTCQLRTV